MQVYALLKKTSQSQSNHHSPTPTPTDSLADKAAILKRHLDRCRFKVNDTIAFKKPRRNRITGIIRHIETDIDKVVWSSKGDVPFFITVDCEQHIRGKVEKMNGLKTYESRLRKL